LISISMLLWPLVVTYLLAVAGYNSYQMWHSKAINGNSMFWVAYDLFFAVFLFRIGVFRGYMIQGQWVQFLERAIMCCRQGKLLQVVSVSDCVSDVILDEDFVKTNGDSNSVRVLGPYHIRRSIDLTMTKLLESSAFASIQEDNIQNPKYFLTGQGSASIDGAEELWTTHTSVSSWAAFYGWCESIRIGSTSIPLQDNDGVLGHILLLETFEPLDRDRISTVCLLPLLPSFVGQSRVIQRRGYFCRSSFGNFEHGVPDAFIFRKNMMEETGLKIKHTFRICACASTYDEEAPVAAVTS